MFEKTSLFCRELTEMEKVISLRLMRFNRAILRACFSFMLFLKLIQIQSVRLLKN
jgi:hypothetical protein